MFKYHAITPFGFRKPVDRLRAHLVRIQKSLSMHDSIYYIIIAYYKQSLMHCLFTHIRHASNG